MTKMIRKNTESNWYLKLSLHIRICKIFLSGVKEKDRRRRICIQGWTVTNIQYSWAFWRGHVFYYANTFFDLEPKQSKSHIFFNLRSTSSLSFWQTQPFCYLHSYLLCALNSLRAGNFSLSPWCPPAKASLTIACTQQGPVAICWMYR